MNDGLLLDSNVLIAIVDDRIEALGEAIGSALAAEGPFFASAASLWEIAIKVRLGKLPLRLALDLLPAHLDAIDIRLLPILPGHAIAEAAPLPATKDPFDRLLLAICAVEELRLLTLDRALIDHPLAWRPSAA